MPWDYLFGARKQDVSPTASSSAAIDEGANKGDYSLDTEWDSAALDKFLGTTSLVDEREHQQSTYFPLAHVRQQTEWDCGVACLQMVSIWIRDDTKVLGEERDRMLELAATESLWTADLVLLLDTLLERKSARPKGNFLFSTKCLSVNMELEGMDYYNAAFSKDTARVQKAFAAITADELPAVQTDRLSMAAIVQVIERPNCLAIALVNNRVYQSMDFSKVTGPYAGHYVIITGTSRQQEHLEAAHEESRKFCLVTYNPAVDGGNPVYISVDRFEKAWRSDGTDEDIIFVSKSAF